MNAKPVVCVGVCTIQRPQMLGKCLRSLSSQKNLGDLEFHILVVDNDASPSSAPVVERVSPVCPFPIHYHHEPRRGIPMARNRVLEEGLSLGADWVGFIDDDQTAYPDWVEKLLFVAGRDKADAVAARKEYIVPEPLPFWLVSNPDRKPAAGPAREAVDGPVENRRRNELATNGVMLSAKLIRADGLGLRFDERLALGGLEDGEFFESAHTRGALLVASCLPAVTEERHRSRSTYRRQVMRGLAMGGALVARHRLSNGNWRTAGRYAAVSMVRALRGAAQLLISPIFVPFAMQRFKFTALEGGRNICVAAGMLGGLFSLQYEFYREIDGY